MTPKTEALMVLEDLHARMAVARSAYERVLDQAAVLYAIGLVQSIAELKRARRAPRGGRDDAAVATNNSGEAGATGTLERGGTQ